MRQARGCVPDSFFLVCRGINRYSENMKIGILDADLLDHGTRHPNLALMKISSYLKAYYKRIKQNQNIVECVLSYDDISVYDKLIRSTTIQ